MLVRPPFRLTRAPAATVDFITNLVQATDLTVYTFSSVSFGVAAANRKIIISSQATSSTAGARNISSLTVGGISATEVDTMTDASGQRRTAIWEADVPTGTSGDIVVTYNGACARCGIGVYRVTTSAATFSDSDAANFTSGTVATGTIDIPAEGVSIGVVGGTANLSATWANLTEDFDTNIESNMHYSGASDAFASDQTALAITATMSAAISTVAIVVASWGKE